jgi:hypothetical protein
MNRNESAQLFSLVKGNFPNAYKDIDNVQATIMINSWHRFFHDIPYQVMLLAVEKHCFTNDWPPTVKQLREAALAILKPQAPVTPFEAWEKVRKAIPKFGYMREKEALESFDATTRRIVKTIGWLNLCKATDERQDFQRKEFIENYKEFGTTEHDKYILPAGMLKKLQETASHKELNQPNEMS